MAPARTGRAKRRRIAVISTDQTNKGTFSILRLGGRILRIVEMKLIAPRIEDTPAMWREKMVRSTAGPEWAKKWASGG